MTRCFYHARLMLADCFVEPQLCVVGVGDVSLLPPMLYLCFPNNVTDILD
jgi:hypothetical protein